MGSLFFICLSMESRLCGEAPSVYLPVWGPSMR